MQVPNLHVKPTLGEIPSFLWHSQLKDELKAHLLCGDATLGCQKGTPHSTVSFLATAGAEQR